MKRLTPVIALLLLLAVGQAFATDPPKKITLSVPMTLAPTPVPVPQAVAPGQLIQIKVTGADLAAAKRCKVVYYPRPTGMVFVPAVGWDGSLNIFFSAPASGEYLVGVYSPPVAAADAVVGAEIIVKVGDPGPAPVPPPVPPGPTPPPGPVPPPVPPAPVAQAIQCIVVEDVAQSTPDLAAVRNSLAIRNWATAGGHSVHFLPHNSPFTGTGPNWAATWQARGIREGLPRVFIMPQAAGDNTILFDGPEPANESAMVKLLQQFGGTGTTCGPTGCPFIRGATTR